MKKLHDFEILMDDWMCDNTSSNDLMAWREMMMNYKEAFLTFLTSITDENGKINDKSSWMKLCHGLATMARIEKEEKEDAQGDFQQYAKIYDTIIGQPCLDGFMKKYLNSFGKQYAFSWESASVLSLGCGTGLVEEFMIRTLKVPNKQLMGLDKSPGMIAIASRRIQAIQADLLSFNPGGQRWDLVYCGLNVLHYLAPSEFIPGIQKISELLKPGGWFVGDFITPDHMRWYPNVLYSTDQRQVSLRTPSLVEEDTYLFQESHILNLDFSGDTCWINLAGVHRRYLPAILRVREAFRDCFGYSPVFWDAFNQNVLPEYADTCPSTRYVVLAKKG